MPVQQNYFKFERKYLINICAFEHFQGNLLGCKFYLRTNHRAPAWLFPKETKAFAFIFLLVCDVDVIPECYRVRSRIRKQYRPCVFWSQFRCCRQLISIDFAKCVPLLPDLPSKLIDWKLKLTSSLRNVLMVQSRLLPIS